MRWLWMLRGWVLFENPDKTARVWVYMKPVDVAFLDRLLRELNKAGYQQRKW